MVLKLSADHVCLPAFGNFALQRLEPANFGVFTNKILRCISQWQSSRLYDQYNERNCVVGLDQLVYLSVRKSQNRTCYSVDTYLLFIGYASMKVTMLNK